MGRQFEKLRRNPVFGGRETGTCFDAYVSKDGERYRMDFSWRKKKLLAVTFSDDGINWDEPQVTLGPDEASGWEENVNRNCVLKIDGVYRMWYTGQARGYSFIGLAESADGIRFTRIGNEPVLIPERAWEGFSVMNPLIVPASGEWDEDACYKPTALWNEEEGKWMVWYNGRKRDEEYFGLAELRQRDLF